MTERLRKLRANLPAYVAMFGWAGLPFFAWMRYSRSRAPFPLLMRGRPPLWLRPASTDLMTFREIFIEQDYAFAPAGEVKVVVDAGANVGLSAVFFAHRYPHARIIALEPEEQNYRLLVRNTRAYPNVQPLHAALWSHTGAVALVDPGRGAHGFTTTAAGENVPALASVSCIDMQELMRRFGMGHVDLLKVDIEGAEKEVFGHASAWIGQVRNVIVELHDRFESGCEETFMRATRHLPRTQRKGKLVMKSIEAHR